MDNGPVDPPDIGEALAASWNAFKKDPGPVLIGYVVAYVAIMVAMAVIFLFQMILAANLPFVVSCVFSIATGFLPLLAFCFFYPGMYLVSLKSIRGQKPEIADCLVTFRGQTVDHVIMQALQWVGALLCGFGYYVTHALFFLGSFFVLDRQMPWAAAKDRCLAMIKPNLVSWVIFSFVISLVSFAGILACGIGIFVSLPIGIGALAYAYDRLGKGPAPLPPLAPAAAPPPPGSPGQDAGGL